MALIKSKGFGLESRTVEKLAISKNSISNFSDPESSQDTANCSELGESSLPCLQHSPNSNDVQSYPDGDSCSSISSLLTDSSIKQSLTLINGTDCPESLFAFDTKTDKQSQREATYRVVNLANNSASLLQKPIVANGAAITKFNFANENNLASADNNMKIEGGKMLEEDLLTKIKTERIESVPCSVTSAPLDNLIGDGKLPESTDSVDIKPQVTFEKGKDVYYFESDHLALKNNRDYQNFLGVVNLLEAQRSKAIADLEILLKEKSRALENPVEFVKKLQEKKLTKLPSRQALAEIPDINWSKYSTHMQYLVLSAKKHSARVRKSKRHETVMSSSSSGLDLHQSAVSSIPGMEDTKQIHSHWSSEEQKQLEMLLVEHPSEEVEVRRWEKIAKALGNRTTLQVQSRVQKYFIKLARMGLPIPGRMPNMQQYKIRSRPYHQRFNQHYYSQSNMIQAFDLPVHMPDEDVPHDFTSSEDINLSIQNIPEHLKRTKEYAQLAMLEQLREEKLHNMDCHAGYKCDMCGCDPIVGIRWHCVTCPPTNSVDFCAKCCSSGFEVGEHTCAHRLEALDPGGINEFKTSELDADYAINSVGECSYLDPNYMPVT